MQLSTRGRYAVMAMVDLASRQSLGCECGPVCLAEIAASQQLSQSYLEQLFAKLRRSGLVASARGPGGGYRLARDSDRISVAAIIAAVDEPIRATRCTEQSGSCLALPGQVSDRCQTHDLWAELGRQISLFLGNVSLADVVLGQIRGRAVAPSRGFARAGKVTTDPADTESAAVTKVAAE
jgi:Rrf2 family iron-sulfur cluster assembly transcriptional regulator